MKRLIFFVAGLALASCVVNRHYDDPIAMMTNRTVDPQERMNAAAQAERERPNDPARVKALEVMLYERGYPTEQRNYAVDKLVSIDEAEFKKTLAKRISLIVNWDTMKHIFKVAEDRQWTDMTPTFVRQYARADRFTPDAERPERELLTKLNPGKSVEQVVFDVFADRDNQVPGPQQVAAWELLNRLTTPARLMELLGQAPGSSPLVIDLKACAADLHTLPVNREGVLWLSYLRDPSRRDAWDAYRAKVAQLGDEQRRGLELRHLPILQVTDDATLKTSRAELWKTISHDLSGQEHATKNPTFDGADKDTPQTLNAWESKLCWADLLTIHTLMQAVLTHGSASGGWFEQADRDNQDTSTEYGGALLAGSDGKFEAKLFVPEQRRHDLKFLSPQPLVEAVYTGLAHYHFHAQSYHNSEYAGPGRGDMEFAKKLNFNCLVLTFIDKDHMNVDYYQPNGAVVDLGTISR